MRLPRIEWATGQIDREAEVVIDEMRIALGVEQLETRVGSVLNGDAVGSTAGGVLPAPR